MRARSGLGARRWRAFISRHGVLLAAAGITFSSSPLHAEPEKSETPQYGWQEVWAGVDATRDVWLFYSGVTLAPWSKDIYSDGFRLRATGGYGKYKVEAGPTHIECGNAGQDQCASTKGGTVDVTLTYTDALIGYQQRFSELTAKAFVGATMIEHSVAKPEIGIKGMIELWLNLGNNAWTSLDLSYATAYDTAAARWRAGFRALPTLSIGPELRYDHNNIDYGGAETRKGLLDRHQRRGGVFARYEWFGGEASIAAGLAETVQGGVSNNIDPYATFNILFQY